MEQGATGTAAGPGDTRRNGKWRGRALNRDTASNGCTESNRGPALNWDSATGSIECSPAALAANNPQIAVGSRRGGSPGP